MIRCAAWKILSAALCLAAAPAAAFAEGSSALELRAPAGDAATADVVLFSFGNDEPWSGRWMIVNDGVMGGLSESRLVGTGSDTALFEGRVSLENNGGFASVRTRPAALPTARTARLAIRVRGDGREYQLRIRTADRFDGVAYRSSFTTRDGDWMTVVVPYSDFVPSWRGRVLRDVPPIDPSKIRQLGLLIADKKEGPFRLEVDWIKALE